MIILRCRIYIRNALRSVSSRTNKRKENAHGTAQRWLRSIDEYIATFPEDIQALLEVVRATIKAAAPETEERISYQIPTFVQNGNLVHFAALKKHIGFYPTSSGIEAFKDEVSRYEGTKGDVKFPISHPLPMELISKIVHFRLNEKLNKAEAKARKKKA